MTVNVFTEWGELKEVIVGSVFNASNLNTDLSFKLFFNDNIKDIFLKNSVELQKKLILERQEDLDRLAEILSSLGIKVHRPEKLCEVKKFITPSFEEYSSPCDNPRDQVLIYGNNIIETPCIWRKRYFENDLLKNILYEKYHQGANWIAAPRPAMKDSSFDLEYAKKTGNINIDWNTYEVLEKKYEMMFDAAQCLKFGQDIIMNVANKNHEMGFAWLKRLLFSLFGEKVRIHPVNLADHHIDSMLMPLKPGVLLIDPDKMHGKIDNLPIELRSWEKIIVPEECRPSAELSLASASIYTNVLPLGKNRVLIFSENREQDFSLKKTLEDKKIEVIHVRLRHSRLFSGGAHCATLDLKRDDEFIRYF